LSGNVTCGAVADEGTAKIAACLVEIVIRIRAGKTGSGITGYAIRILSIACLALIRCGIEIYAVVKTGETGGVVTAICTASQS